MTGIRLYHNPRCSKSRAALALLRERGVEPEIVEYLREPPSRAELETLARRLGLEPCEWVRRGEAAFGEASLSDASGADEILDAMLRHPILIERPIAVSGERAVVGRPPERVLELLTE
ncbi:MAG: arsenate reductase (glutaredoxin) [Myxococcota bacterium]